MKVFRHALQHSIMQVTLRRWSGCEEEVVNVRDRNLEINLSNLGHASLENLGLKITLDSSISPPTETNNPLPLLQQLVNEQKHLPDVSCSWSEASLFCFLLRSSFCCVQLFPETLGGTFVSGQEKESAEKPEIYRLTPEYGNSKMLASSLSRGSHFECGEEGRRLRFKEKQLIYKTAVLSDYSQICTTSQSICCLVHFKKTLLHLGND